MSRVNIAAGALAVTLIVVATLAALGVGGSDEPKREDATSAAAVRDAVEGTGYTITYRKVADVDGFEAIAGRAVSASNGTVDFSVTIDLNGRYKGDAESPRGGSPQIPVIRYLEDEGTVVGNLAYYVQPQSPRRVGRVKGLGRAWIFTRGELQMSGRIARAIEDLFAPSLRGTL